LYFSIVSMETHKTQPFQTCILPEIKTTQRGSPSRTAAFL